MSHKIALADLAKVPQLETIASTCDHIDSKSYQGEGLMSDFLSGFLSYQPAWLKGLYHVRGVFVRLLGMKQEKTPDMGEKDQVIPMQAGEKAAIFTVNDAKHEDYWLVSATEKHLTAYLCVTATDIETSPRTFNVITLVKYHHWTGIIYFTVIKPFHHIVVDQMAKAGVKYASEKIKRV